MTSLIYYKIIKNCSTNKYFLERMYLEKIIKNSIEEIHTIINIAINDTSMRIITEKCCRILIYKMILIYYNLNNIYNNINNIYCANC